MAREMTAASLAREAELEVDDVLLLIWEVGIEYPTTPTSLIRPGDHDRARDAVGITPVRRRLLISYWIDLLGLTPTEFRAWAAQVGVAIPDGARKLPKGALRKIERSERSRTARDERKVKADPPRVELQPFEWRPVGLARDTIRHLSSDEVEAIHFQIAADFAGSSDPIAPAGVRSHDLLESAATRPHTAVFGERKYPTVEMACAAITHSLVHNHPFHNGNKRTALVSMLVSLDENGMSLVSSQEDVFKWILRVASHRLGAERFDADRHDVEVLLMSQWISQNSRRTESGERVITFATLRRRLHALGCTVSISSNRGGRAIVDRTVEIDVPRLIGKRTKVERRRAWLPYGGDGRQVSRGRIKDMRRELHLSDEYGVDSAAFYGTDDRPVDDFIAIYRKTLQRLARL
ncbi:type II toxin-antitoxin system death-on-curing family toxin [Microbacterium sp. LWO12-1.2]|uniref:type II toxin-antitoxin system death-on-curing family toxin n=1 Tax=Microbacterium sp. LWO12-1.2 TaxID=3135261 RepID=UPI0034392386